MPGQAGLEKIEKITLVDGHAHLDELKDLEDALREAREARVKGIVGVGVNRASNEKILAIARENPGSVYPAIGYHPWQMKEEEVEENLSFLRDHVKGCLALGEIGLDYKVKVKKDLQWKVFGELLEIALENDKPIIIHCRYSHKRVLEMVIEKEIKRAAFHWYTGPVNLLEEILRRGYFISATPALAYSPPLQEAIRKAPLERILLETDSPVSYQGKEARPKDVWITLREVARLKGVDFLTVGKQTTTNTSILFRTDFDARNSNACESYAVPPPEN
jgi:TatD DNase family protein